MSQFALEIARRLLPAATAAGGGRPDRSQHLIIDQCGSTLAVILLRLSHTAGRAGGTAVCITRSAWRNSLKRYSSLDELDISVSALGSSR